MKLLQKTNRVYFLYSTLLLLSSGLLLYFILTNLVKEELTEKLSLNIDRIIYQLETGETVSSLPPIIEIKELHHIPNIEMQIKDTLMYDPINGDKDLFHQIQITKNIHNKTYQIIARQVILEPHDFYNSIGISLLIIFTLLIFGLLFIQRNISKKIWHPFYLNIEEMKSFSLNNNSKIKLQKSNITEFDNLNTTIELLTEKIQSDYKTLKDFTENASHEMQTPVAIIKSKMEIMMQESSLSELQISQINSTYNAAIRLTKLNKSLLLLAQIENEQFHQKSMIDIVLLIEKQIDFCEDFILEKKLIIEKFFPSTLHLFANQNLLEILFSNLLFNAIKHNIHEGKILISINQYECSFSNTGKPLITNAEKLFERFKKNDPSSDSIGLGLTIAKKICAINQWEIKYEYHDSFHSIHIAF